MTSEQLRAARALLRWEQKDLAEAADVPLQTVKRLEIKPGALTAYQRTVDSLQTALEAGGIEFIFEGAGSEEGGGAGVRFAKRD
jgi:transcriptional regulator with XRE-family HTH domain